MRKPLQDIYMETALAFSQRATCNRKKVGGVLIKDGRIVLSGYCGSPSSLPHCIDEDVGCLIQVRDGRESCIRTLHCEIAMITFAARHGIKLEGTEIYLTLSPCYDCSKALINCGIKGVYYLEEYTGASGIELLREVGIRCEKIDLNNLKEKKEL